MSNSVRHVLEVIFLVPVICGSVYSVLCVLAVARLKMRRPSGRRKYFDGNWPAVTVLKPVHGLEKNLRANLRSTCIQDYPEFEVVFSVQQPDDPAIPLLYEIQREFGTDRVTVAIEHCVAGTNGKINNMLGGYAHARHDIFVISDSDVSLTPDYLKRIVAPLADPAVGCVCTLYKGVNAGRWFEKMELLTLNADFMTNVVFANISGTSKFCLGASAAVRRSTLLEIGGLEALADYLVEDYEMGRRIWVSGKKIEVLPHFVDTQVDLKSASQWWGHMVYWDQNTRAARPVGFFATVIIRSVPFAFLYAAVRLFNPLGLSVLAGTLALRLASAVTILGWGFKDREGTACAPYLLIPRDIASLISWLLAFTKKTTIWRGTRFTLTRDGRLVARPVGAGPVPARLARRGPTGGPPTDTKGRMKKVIVTGDDFGLAVPVNEAIIEAHRNGVLTTASLMVGAAATQDAIERARQVPTLRVGLHLVLVEGRPVSDRRTVPILVNGNGEFSERLVASGFRFFFRPDARRQLETEIRAQFEAFLKTGFGLDHVNAHNHMHLHPTILRLMLEIGRQYGARAVRFPSEPPLRSWRAARCNLASRTTMAVFLWPWIRLMRRALARSGMRCNDWVLGMTDSGRMDENLVIRFLSALPDGVTEIYFHPATRPCPETERTMSGYRHEQEFRALISPAVRREFESLGIQRIAFEDLP